MDVVAGPVSSLGHVPLSELLPERYLAVVPSLRRSADDLDRHRPANEPGVWNWLPAKTFLPELNDQPSSDLLIYTAILPYDTGVDWLELALDIAWDVSPRLVVNTAVEVACWCSPDHNVHPISQAKWRVATASELAEVFAAATTLMKGWLRDGPHNPDAWRSRVGLPNPPNDAGEGRVPTC